MTKQERQFVTERLHMARNVITTKLTAKVGPQSWTDQQTMDYLRERGIPLAPHTQAWRLSGIIALEPSEEMAANRDKIRAWNTVADGIITRANEVLYLDRKANALNVLDETTRKLRLAAEELVGSLD